jgi:hypothetical protein
VRTSARNRAGSIMTPASQYDTSAQSFVVLPRDDLIVNFPFTLAKRSYWEEGNRTGKNQANWCGVANSGE